MTNVMAPPNRRDPIDWRAIVAAGLICGTLDINAAFVSAWFVSDVGPVLLLKYVAGGLLGSPARDGGWGFAVFGLGLHFCVAFSVTFVFYALSRRLGFLRRQAAVSGLVYGAIVYLVMNLAVLPLAAQFRSLYLPDTKPFVPHLIWPQFCIHLTCVGLAISLSLRRFARGAESVRPAD